MPSLRRFISMALRATRAHVASFNRLLFLGIGLLGLGALAQSTRKSWFEVPQAPLHGADSPLDMIAVTPECMPVFQALMGVGLVALAASWAWRRQWTIFSTVLGSVLCLVPLAFPYFVMLRSPVVSAEAAWLQLQHDNLLWLGGDIYNNAEYAHRGWKSKAYLIDLPQQLAVVKLPSWSPWEIGLDRCGDLLLWLGYSNAFCNFVCKGWAMAIIGSQLLLLCTLQRKSEFQFPHAGVAIAIFTGGFVVSALVGWSLPFRASNHIKLASELCSQREFRASIDELDKAVALLPVLGQDTYYVAQRGVLERALGLVTDYTRLGEAIDLESDARYDQAYARIAQLIESEDPAIRRESLRAVMRFAIQDYNCARFETSAERFRIVLRQQPCNLKLIYLMQLQGIRESRPEVVYAMRDWMYEASGKMAFGTKTIVRAAANQHAVLAAGMEGNADAICAAQDRAKRP